MINKHYENIHKHNFLTKELLRKEYIDNNLTDKQIAKKYNISSKVIIWRKRKKFGIKNKFENKSNKNASINRKFHISKEKAEKLLQENKTFKEISEIMNCSLVVARRRFEELGLTKKQKQTTAYKYYDVNLNGCQKQLIIGSLLGDGHITQSGAYACSHSIKQKEYFDHKMKILSNLHSGCFQNYIHSYSYLKQDAESLHFTTGCNKYLYKLKKIYYPNKKKIFPFEYLKENLAKEGLAYWYCDDGGLSTNSVILNTYGYSYDEQKLMSKLLLNKFGITTKIYSCYNLYKLRIPTKCSKKFISLIAPYIIPSMRYKIEPPNLKNI